ncbi:YerC/YecD family TrpR-related protein [Niallia oryzisoli]|uniref:YerC/YecD family TrpR-related protein n=1 Tax=Niallia oryzisoli TaxID=1737571 RepID=A0ABZ2CFE3_9BACI
MHGGNLSEDKIKQLFNAILSLQTKEECMDFFDDLCTTKELNSFVQRLVVARLLREGATYMDIQIETDANSTTIARVKQQLDNGNGGFSLVLDRLAARQK